MNLGEKYIPSKNEIKEVESRMTEEQKKLGSERVLEVMEEEDRLIEQAKMEKYQASKLLKESSPKRLSSEELLQLSQRLAEMANNLKQTEDAYENLKDRGSEKDEIIESINNRANNASERIRQHIQENVVPFMNRVDIASIKIWLSEARNDFYNLVNNPDDPYNLEQYRNWTADEIKELYEALYDEEMD